MRFVHSRVPCDASPAQFRDERSSMGGVVGEIAKESAKERDERIKRENVREERRRDRERAYAAGMQHAA